MNSNTVLEIGLMIDGLYIDWARMVMHHIDLSNASCPTNGSFHAVRPWSKHGTVFIAPHSNLGWMSNCHTNFNFAWNSAIATTLAINNEDQSFIIDEEKVIESNSSPPAPHSVTNHERTIQLHFQPQRISFFNCLRMTMMMLWALLIIQYISTSKHLFRTSFIRFSHS